MHSQLEVSVSVKQNGNVYTKNGNVRYLVSYHLIFYDGFGAKQQKARHQESKTSSSKDTQVLAKYNLEFGFRQLQLAFISNYIDEAFKHFQKVKSSTYIGKQPNMFNMNPAVFCISTLFRTHTWLHSLIHTYVRVHACAFVCLFSKAY